MSVTDKQFAAFVDRVVACREAEDRAKEATKDLYGEIASAGEDKAAIGVLVRELRMTAKDRTKANFKAAAVDDGRARYHRGKASHVRVREASIPEHDPETGVIIEPMDTPASPTTGTRPGAKDVATPPVHAPEQPGNDHGSVSTPDEGGADSSKIPPSEAAMLPQTGAVEPIVANSEAPDPSPPDLLRSVAAPREGAEAGASEPIIEPVIVTPPAITAAGGDRGAPSLAATVAVASNVTAFRTHNPDTHFLNSKGLVRLHGCLKPEACGSESARTKLCFSCSVQHEGPAHAGGAA